MEYTPPSPGLGLFLLMGMHVALVFTGLYQAVGFILPSRPICGRADGHEQWKSRGCGVCSHALQDCSVDKGASFARMLQTDGSWVG